MQIVIDRISNCLQCLAATDLVLPNSEKAIYREILKYCSSLDKAALSRFSSSQKKDTPLTRQPETTMQIHTIIGCDIGNLAASIPININDTLIIFAPSPAGAYLMLDRIDLANICALRQIALFTNHDNFLTYLKKEQNFWKNINLWLTPLSRNKQPELCTQITDEIKYCNAIAANETRTINRHYFNWAENENRNLRKVTLLKHAESSQRGTKLNGATALLLGAGPSLAKIIPFLKRFKQNNQTLIIAASTTLRALEKEDIIPHLTIIIEGEKQTHFSSLSNSYLKRLTLLAALQTNPEHLSYPFKKIHWFHHQTSATAALVNKLLPEALPIPSRGNVISDSLQLALNWGCATIGLCGCDMAYNASQKYCPGLEKEDSDQNKMEKKYFTVPGQQGNTLYAPAEFISYAQNLENMAAELKKMGGNQKIYNLSIGGRRIEGIEDLTPAQFYDLARQKSPEINHKLQLFVDSWCCPANKNRHHIDQHHNVMVALHQTLISIQNGESNTLSEYARINTMRHLLDLLPEFTNGAALMMIPWLHHLHTGSNSVEGISRLRNITARLI